MIRHLHLDPSFGASGDMLLGTLCDLMRADRPDIVVELTAALESLGVEGWSIAAAPTVRNGIAAFHVDVHSQPSGARHWSDIDALLARVDLPEGVADGARRTFRALAEVEAAQHAVAIDDVHFHEVGAVDAIVDVVGTHWLLQALAPTSVTIGPVGLGHGTVRAAHGLLPLPAPATVALLTGAPTRALDVEMETCTPTGAALLATIGAWSPMPSGTIVAAGRGAGAKDPADHPNVLTAIVLDTASGAAPEAQPFGASGQAIAAHLISTNLDDVTPEVLGHVVDRLLAAGADDAWIVPVLMKKQRPGHQLNALCSPERTSELRQLIAVETGTLGMRVASVDKFPAPRRWETVSVRGASIRIKVGPFGAKPEHDDLVAASDATGAPVRVLADEARRAWLDGSGRG